MNESKTQPAYYRRVLVWILCCGAISLFVATVMAASRHDGDVDQSGAAPYTPTRGEWLCLLLNSRQALANSERVPGSCVVRYVYDRSRPNVVVIEVLSEEGTHKEHVLRRVARAEHQAVEAAKAYGWKDWLRVEHEERKLTDLTPMEGLIR